MLDTATPTFFSEETLGERHPLNHALEHSIFGNFELSYNILLKLSQDDPRVLFNLGWHNLRLGNLRKGFDLINMGRWINVFGSPPLGSGKPIWHPSDFLANKTVLFRCEGGLGDQIFNIRFINYLHRKQAHVIVACDKSLIQFFKFNFPFVAAFVTDEGAKFVEHDYWIPAMSAPGLFLSDYSEVSGLPYLTSPKSNVLDFSTHRGHGLRIGLKWSGNPLFEHEQHRKFPEQLMFDLISPKHTFFSLQREDDHSTLPQLPMDTWSQTAESIASLDLVITSCTSIAHLAGALGKPTWVVIPILSYYTWSWPGDSTTPWYESVRLFRQTEYGSWTNPFAQIKALLAQHNPIPKHAHVHRQTTPHHLRYVNMS